MTGPLRWPVYVPSRGRALTCTTPDLLATVGIPCTLVVEPQEVEAYAKRHGSVVSLDDSGRGIAYARTSVKRLSEARGEEWHWQLDDDILHFRCREKDKPSVVVSATVAMGFCENLAAKYENVGAVGLASAQWPTTQPFHVNQQVYSHVLYRNGTPVYWRPGCVDDTDFSLQILAAGWCTILAKTFRAMTPATESQAGGNTDGDVSFEGRARRIRQLQAYWPGLGIGMTRGHGGVPRPITSHIWRRFTTPLIAATQQEA